MDSNLLKSQRIAWKLGWLEGEQNVFVVRIPYHPILDEISSECPTELHRFVVRIITALAGNNPRICVKLTTNKWEWMDSIFRGMLDIHKHVSIPSHALCYLELRDHEMYVRTKRFFKTAVVLPEDENEDVQTPVTVYLEFADVSGEVTPCAQEDKGKSIYFSKSPIEIIHQPLALQYFLNNGGFK